MLFNAPIFLFYFLPATLLVGIALRRRFSEPVFLAFIVVASLIFYSWTNAGWVFILIGSIIGNYFLSQAINNALDRQTKTSLLVIGVGLNLTTLAVYKYTTFVTGNLIAAGLTFIPHIEIVLPIGISFYTFQQIAYLVDSYKGVVKERNFLRYAFFVAFFPQLIAGPIVHHSEIMTQFRRGFQHEVSFNLAIGLVIFFIGLTKKVLLADTFALYSTPVFAAADAGQAISQASAWTAVIAYALQIYFDFSGYSDMAIGIGRMFGFRLPVNFNSPYKATSIIDFWRRWHMTLSRFLRDYLYIPLGGNRNGVHQRYINLMITMLLGGLWHGAGWGFILWGLMHGVFLSINHVVIKFKREQNTLDETAPPYAHLFKPGFYLTLLLVALAWVPFRAETLSGALTVWSSLLFVPEGVRDSFDKGPMVLALGCIVALALPNTQDLLKRLYHYVIPMDFYSPYVDARAAADGSFDNEPMDEARDPISWAGYAFAMIVAVTSVCGLALNNRISEFIYFQF